MSLTPTLQQRASKVSKFWESIREGRLTGTRCDKCDKTYCPPRNVCPSCLSDGVQWIELTGRGSILTFTVISAPPSDFEKLAPYVVVIVKLDDGPQLTGMLVGVPPEMVEIGMRVEAISEAISENRFVYRFKPTAF